MSNVVKKNISVGPSSGSGNTTLTVKASPANLGNRVKQTQVFSVSATGVSESKSFTANLLPKAEFVSFDNGASMAVSKTGGTVTIKGKSNSASLTFTKGSGSVITANITAIKYTANGSEATNGVAISGDPGASRQYEFTLTLTAAANGTINARRQQITVVGAGGTEVAATITLNQTAGDPTLSVSPTTVDVPQDGTTVTVNVVTNTTFTVTAN